MRLTAKLLPANAQPIPLVVTMSVKGGTGKTLNSINIAIELSRHFNVGILVADVDSPALPAMLGLKEPITLTQEKYFVPATYTYDNRTIKVMSVGLFQRGIMTMCKTGIENKQIITDMLKNSVWGDVQVIVVDLSAGSSDEARAVMESTWPLIGVVTVTLPNTHDDCWRVIEICSRFKMNILGIIENQKGAICGDCLEAVVCKKCGKPYIPFANPDASKTIEELAKRTHINHLGSIPLIAGMYAFIMNGTPLFPPPHNAPILKVVDMVKYVLAPPSGGESK